MKHSVEPATGPVPVVELAWNTLNAQLFTAESAKHAEKEKNFTLRSPRALR